MIFINRTCHKTNRSRRMNPVTLQMVREPSADEILLANSRSINFNSFHSGLLKRPAKAAAISFKRVSDWLARAIMRKHGCVMIQPSR
jgi:hypothetical protein